MAKQKYRVRVLRGAQELVLLVPAAPETTVGELQAEVLARARRKNVLGSACELSVDGASLDEFDSLEDVVEVDQTIDAELSSPNGSALLSPPSRITPAKRSEPEGGFASADEDVAASAPAGADESDDEEYHWLAAAPRGAALVGRRDRVWWPHDRAWFTGLVNAFASSRLYEITYADGSLWDEDLAERRWELLLDESGLKAHERELLRVERLIAAGKLSHKSSAGGGVYRRFYELCGVVNPNKEQKKSLRERTRLIIEPFLDAPVTDTGGNADDVPPP